MPDSKAALFTPLALRSVELENRIVVSPMCQYSAVDGLMQDWHLMHLGQYAVSGAGLVFTEATAVEPEGRISPGCPSLHSTATEDAITRVVDFCRRHGSASLGIQLAHAGRKASTRPPWEGYGFIMPDEGGWECSAPSAIPYDPKDPPPVALESQGLQRIVAAFVGAVRRAERIGFDVVELHAAHGYLLHQFLSPLSNKRTDSYGGSLVNRMRLVLEVFAAMRSEWPRHKPLGVRISASDWVPGGWDIDESVVLARELRELGCDFIDVSSGGLAPQQRIATGPGYQVPFAERIRNEAGIRVIAVGMITEPFQADEVVNSGKADLVALARGMLDDPRWAWHAADRLGIDLSYPKQYRMAHPSRLKKPAWPDPKPS